MVFYRPPLTPFALKCLWAGRVSQDALMAVTQLIRNGWDHKAAP